MQAMIAAFKENPSYVGIEESVKQNKLPLHLWGADRRLLPLIVESMPVSDRQRLIVTYDEKRAREIVEDYRFFDRNVYYYPAKDALFYYADVHGNATMQSRLEIIKHLAENEHIIIVTTIEGLMDKIPPIDHITENVMEIMVGQTVSLSLLSDTLTMLGYEKTPMVEVPGQFSVRGGIIDIFPLTEECPYRVELWGDEVDSVRSFDVESQRSIEELSKVRIYPSCEMVLTEEKINKGIDRINAEYEHQSSKLKEEFRTEQYARLKKITDTIKEELTEFGSATSMDSLINYFFDETFSVLDYIPGDTVVCIDEPEKTGRQAQMYFREFAQSMQGRLEGGYVLPGQTDVLYGGREIVGKLACRKLILISELYKLQPLFGERDNVMLTSRGLVNYNNSFDRLMSDIDGWLKKKYKIIILSPSSTRGKRIVSDLRDNDITARFTEGHDSTLWPGEVLVSTGRLETGFELPNSRLVVISEGDIFNSKDIKKRKKLPKYKGDKVNSFSDLSVGDYVVHERHGVGIYRGIEKVETDGRLRDYISIEYDKGSKLFVPVEQLDIIGRLSGKDGVKPKLNRLGGVEWDKVRQRVRGHIADIARELVELYAVRETSKGFAYSADTPWQREFEELFPYEETSDQQKAIDDTKRDMESPHIMDRLVCGDVGFGKTEVAIRAAFKAVQDNKQVAYLVPTTILAEQHFNTFTERMNNFPVNIRMLSRFCTSKEIKQTLAEMKNGTADIVIGTHRLLSKDIEFKNLGLLIIDEEQRFGVKHKECIKQMKKNVDVLTLTATPIPRTLHMSLVGLRDISLLEEAPVDRMPIQTFVMEYDMEFVKEAVSRELSRQGQVYYVYNRVNTIEDMTLSLRAVLPDARIEFAHGRMNERELENIMHDFINRKIDVLVSTTIIETGLDIPNVNTMIIHDADTYGLSQLYQLRGRVGRSNRSAFAFLLYRRDKVIKEVAEKRLKAIREFTDLGSGYKISMKDLEIRGAGNLLGQEQSGNIEAVGYDLYCKMLNDEIKRLSGKEVREDYTTSIELPVDAHIPDTYIRNEYMKLDLYKRISRCESREENDGIMEEVRDRFGEPPKSFVRLLDIAYLKALAHSAYITDVKYLADEVRFIMLPDAPVHAQRVDALLKSYNGKLRLITGKYVGFALKTSKTVQDELLNTVEQGINNIMCLIGGNNDDAQDEGLQEG